MPLFYVCAAFLAGVAAAGRAAWTGAAGLSAAGICLLIAIGLAALPVGPGPRRTLDAALARVQLDPAAVPRRVIRMLPLLAAAAFALGAARYSVRLPAPDVGNFIARYSDDGLRYSVIGTLRAPPDNRDSYTNLQITAEEIRPANGVRHLPVRGVMLARVAPGGSWAYGDRVVVTGAMKTPGENEAFSYRDYLARQGIYAYVPFGEAAVLERGQGSLFMGWIYAFKARALSVLHAEFPDPEASLLAGILLGQDSGLSPGIQQAFRDTGTSHIIAISGFNISLIAAIFMAFFGRVFGQRVGTWVAVFVISVYTLLVGADPAVVRAAIMGGMAIALRRVGRSQSALNSLMMTATVMVFLNPLVLADVGFQLSFSATLGLVLYAEPLSQAFARIASRYLRVSTVRRILPVTGDAVLLTLAAQITTLPVILFHFGRLSLTAFLVNPLILPVQPAVMVLGGLSLLAGMAWLPAGKLLALAAYPFAAYSIRMVEIFSAVRGGVVAVGEVGWGMVALALAGPQLVRALRVLGVRFRIAYPVLRAAGLLALLGAVVWAWRTGTAASPGMLRMWLLDVGMGEAVLVQTPGDRWVLINGGPSAARLAEQLGRRIPFSQRSLDWLVVAGTADDQLAALPRLLEQYRPGRALWAGMQNITQNTQLMQDNMNKFGVPVFPAETGQSLDLGDGAALEVLSVTPRGAVLALRWHAVRILLPTGADFDSLNLDLPPVSGLLLADSGYAPLNPPEWIEGLRPQFILLSTAAGNRQGLPDPALLDALAGYTLLRTDRHGSIEIATDGTHAWITSGRLQGE